MTVYTDNSKFEFIRYFIFKNVYIFLIKFNKIGIEHNKCKIHNISLEIYTYLYLFLKNIGMKYKYIPHIHICVTYTCDTVTHIYDTATHIWHSFS